MCEHNTIYKDLGELKGIVNSLHTNVSDLVQIQHDIRVRIENLEKKWVRMGALSTFFLSTVAFVGWLAFYFKEKITGIF